MAKIDSTAKPASKNSKSLFGTPAKVMDICEKMQTIENVRASDRAKINVLANGQQPYTEEECKRCNIEFNVNWGELKRIVTDGISQVDNATLHQGRLFSCTLESGPVDKRGEWSETFTDLIHIPLQRGESGQNHNDLIHNRNTSLVPHGIGPLIWTTPHRWLARYMPLEDLLIPTDTLCGFKDLTRFAANLYLTPGEFITMTKDDKTQKGWNPKMVNEVLDSIQNQPVESASVNWNDQPEAMMEIFKQNAGWYYSDAVPRIKLRQFYYKDMESKKWYRSIVLRETMAGVSLDKFLYDGSDEPFADSISHILHVQYLNTSTVAPVRYHSVRGTGVDLFGPADTLNRLRNRIMQAAFEDLCTLFRIRDPADRDRLKEVVLQNYGFIPEGLEIVPREQRHEVNLQLSELGLGQMRQIMQESSASFVQDTAGKENGEMTAKEAVIRLNQATTMISGMISRVYAKEAFYYEEIVRRFCLPHPADPEVKAFQEKCKRAGIPDEMMKADKWRVEPERVLGGGDHTQAQMESAWLFQNRMAFAPESQQKIMRLTTRTMTRNDALAKQLVPDAPKQATQGTYAAENVFGTLMQGVQISLRSGFDQQGYIEAMLKMMGSVIQRITATDNVGTPDELVGLVTCAQNVGQHIMILAGDDTNKEQVRKYSDVMGQMMNVIKGFAQRQSEQRDSQQQQGDPAQAAKAQTIVQTAQIKNAIKIQQAQIKQKEKMIDFQLEQARENMRTISEINRENAAHKQKMFNESLASAADAIRQVSRAKAENPQNS